MTYSVFGGTLNSTLLLHRLKINKYWIWSSLSYIYDILPTGQPAYLYKLISVQAGCTSVITITRPPSFSSIKITNHSSPYESPCFWNYLPVSFHQPDPNHSPSYSSHPTHLGLSVPSSPLSLAITPPRDCLGLGTDQRFLFSPASFWFNTCVGLNWLMMSVIFPHMLIKPPLIDWFKFSWLWYFCHMCIFLTV